MAEGQQQGPTLPGGSSLVGPLPKPANARPWYARVEWSDTQRNVLFGGVLGSIMGVFFGVQSGMTVAGAKNLGENMDTLAVAGPKRTQVFKVIGGTSATFGLFFASFQGLFHITSTIREDPIDFAQFAAVGAVAVAPFLKVEYMRKNLPFAAIFVGLDAFSWYTQKQKNA